MAFLSKSETFQGRPSILGDCVAGSILSWLTSGAILTNTAIFVMGASATDEGLKNLEGARLLILESSKALRRPFCHEDRCLAMVDWRTSWVPFVLTLLVGAGCLEASVEPTDDPPGTFEFAPTVTF